MPVKGDFEFALGNIARWGDTDVFPFAPENHILFDSREQVADLLVNIHQDPKASMVDDPPVNQTALQLVTYEGFRWCSQLDPLWNAYLLGLVYAAAGAIEDSRIDRAKGTVFSYRFAPDNERHSLYDDGSWNQFVERTQTLANQFDHLVVTDIADFYGRLYHHRIENALQQLPISSDTPAKVNSVLSSYSGGASYGLPVGGPAARTLSELALNRVDKLLEMHGVTFVRFADDYRIFSQSEAQAFEHLILLTELLHRHEGLTLQKHKTRMLRSADFLRSPLFFNAEKDKLTPSEKRQQEFLSISLRFDPYSPTASDDYTRLKRELQKFDVLEMLTREVAKSRVSIPVVRRIAQSLTYMEEPLQEAAVGTIIDNLEMLAPALPVVLRVLDSLCKDLAPDVVSQVTRALRDRISDGAAYMRLPINVAYAFRVLRHEKEEANYYLAVEQFQGAPPFLQRDLVIHMHNWTNSDWISEQRRQWTNHHPWVKRAILLASYGLGDEGSHWRKRLTLSPFDQIARNWMAARVQSNRRELPL